MLRLTVDPERTDAEILAAIVDLARVSPRTGPPELGEFEVADDASIAAQVPPLPRVQPDSCAIRRAS